MNLPIDMAVLPRRDLEKLHYLIQAFLNTPSSGPTCIHHSRKHSLHIIWVAMGNGLLEEVGGEDYVILYV
jgi:hypothetical protein